MADIVPKEVRSRMMAGIGGKNTRPELLVRKGLHAAGFRYRLHDRALPGKPDIVLPKYRAVIFVHGCFWHRHPGCRYASTPATRPEFWASKFSANVARDSAARSALLLAGWRVATIWECALRTEAGVAAVRDVVSGWLQGDGRELEVGEADIGAPKDRRSGPVGSELT